MNLSEISMQNIHSIRQALGIATLRKSMNQDALTVATLLKDMQAASARTMEMSVTPHKGGNINLRI